MGRSAVPCSVVLLGGMVDVFVHSVVHWEWFGHRDRHVLLYGHVVRLLHGVGYRLLHCDRVRLLDCYVDGLHDRHLYFLRYPHVHGVGLWHRHWNRLGHCDRYRVGHRYLDRLHNWHREVANHLVLRDGLELMTTGTTADFMAATVFVRQIAPFLAK